MTLTEILVAMVVLLVGIYTVARGFPLMLHQIRGEGDRTAMARLAEDMMSRLSENQYGLPDAITGGGDVDPASYSEDMTEPHDSSQLNAQEDVLEVRGETFRVPAPYAVAGAASSTGPARYPLSVGPTEYVDNGYPWVYMLVPLQERLDDPSQAVPGDRNWFWVDKRNAKIVIPDIVTTEEGGETRSWPVDPASPALRMVVDYAWTIDDNAPGLAVTHHVQGEMPPITDGVNTRIGTVRPAVLPAGCRLVAGQTRVWALVEFQREANAVYTPSAPGWFSVEKYGLTLGFHPKDVGLTLKVDYRLRNLQRPGDTLVRRELLMSEERLIQGTADRTDGTTDFTDVRLAFKNVDDDALFSDPDDAADNSLDAYGTDTTEQIHVLAVDTQTGEVYSDGTGLAFVDTNLDPPLEQGFQNGIVTMPLTISGSPAPYLGHVLRFYYRTIDRHNLQVQKAPRAYMDSDTARAYVPDVTPGGVDLTADVNFRTYMLHHRPAPGDATRNVAVLEFGQWLTDTTWATAESTAGLTVAVNYAYSPTDTTREYVWGELHTVAAGGREIALSHTTEATRPIEILAVNGVSVRARGWWLARNGRQRLLDVETVLLPPPLGIIPRAR